GLAPVMAAAAPVASAPVAAPVAPAPAPAMAPAPTAAPAASTPAASSAPAVAPVPAPAAAAQPAAVGAAGPAPVQAASTPLAASCSGAMVEGLVEVLKNPATLQRMWQNAMASIKKANPAHAVLFFNTRPVLDADKGVLIIEVDASNAFAANALQKPEVQNELQQCLDAAAGAPVVFCLQKKEGVSGGAPAASIGSPVPSAPRPLPFRRSSGPGPCGSGRPRAGGPRGNAPRGISRRFPQPALLRRSSACGTRPRRARPGAPGPGFRRSAPGPCTCARSPRAPRRPRPGRRPAPTS
ncbi:hypothetical protein FHR31_001916, partial [Parvibacter caecicola]